jgi:hypothetical protein
VQLGCERARSGDHRSEERIGISVQARRELIDGGDDRREERIGVGIEVRRRERLCASRQRDSRRIEGVGIDMQRIDGDDGNVCPAERKLTKRAVA